MKKPEKKPNKKNPKKKVSEKTFALKLVGRILENRYKIEELIGEGAMGYVYRGSQLRLRRSVAIKVPRNELSVDPEFMSRFEREALSMARCVHENIVTIYDVFVAKKPGQLSYIAMEYITGTNLYRFLRAEEQNLTIKAILDILRQLARGIDAAHAAGVVHRDIKPSNMIVTLPQRIAKIMDFGIAKVELDNIYKTQAGFSLGTPAFMAPEQIRNETIGPPADIYSFGMSLYKIFARALPFDASSSADLLVHHLNEKPLSLKVRNPAWPKEMARALDLSLCKNPEDRPASASLLVEQIEQGLKPMTLRPFADFFQTPQGPPLSFSSGKRKTGFKRYLIPSTVILIFVILGASLGMILKNKFFPGQKDRDRSLIPSAGSLFKKTFSKSDSKDEELKGKALELESRLIDRLIVEEVREPLFREQWDRAQKALEKIDLDKTERFFKLIKKYSENYKNLTLTYIPLERSIGKKKARIRLRTGLTGIPRTEKENSPKQQLVSPFEGIIKLKKEDKDWIITDIPLYEPNEKK